MTSTVNGATIYPMPRPVEIEDGGKLNLWLSLKTRLNAKALFLRRKKRDPKASMARVVGELIDREAKRRGIDDKERKEAAKQSFSSD